jgi:hypothetical protein
MRTLLGRVAKLADAQDSGSCGGNPVEVQVLSRPLFLTSKAAFWRSTDERSGATNGYEGGYGPRIRAATFAAASSCRAGIA